MDLALALIVGCAPAPEVVPVEPDPIEVWLERGDVLLAQLRYDEAQEAWVQAALLEGGNARGVARQGWLEWLEGDLDDAINHFEIALREGLPDDEHALTMARKGWLLALSGDAPSDLRAVADHPAAAPFLERLEGRPAVLSVAETLVEVRPDEVLATGNRQPRVLWWLGRERRDAALLEAALGWPVGLSGAEREQARALLSELAADDQAPAGAADSG